ncbi:hypothetical protein [Flavobacterium cerinum]|uniref:Lipoprotein n=1 Tax=Flavobacterium cerinum TaxID=2502784 RepID=A0ABY5IV50_9FLAO|nr:hypothetical protein [Flavobacterium cerinum]UUC46707.1 hypothetical protein NOX80_05780 [Flavobacterium cerinum]
MKKLVIILTLLFCFSCDPMNDKMSFYNNSDSDVYVRMLFFQDTAITGTMAGLRDVKAREIEEIGKLYSWESEFEDAKNDSLCVVVYQGYDFLNDPYEQSNKIKSDSLLNIGDFKYKKYTIKDFEKKKWRVTYPNDGFKDGKFR